MRPDDSFVAQPVRSLQTMLRVIAEADQRYQVLIPDGIYGPETAQAVSMFQRLNGFPVTGITTQELWEAIVLQYETALIQITPAEPIEIVMNPNKIYKYGDSSPNLFLLQSMLTQLSLSHASISRPPHTGILDDPTIDSLREFQTLSGLPVTGELDRITWKHLVHQFTLNAHHNEGAL